MKFSSRDNKVFSKPTKINDDMPLIAQVSFEDLESAEPSIEITPIACKNCGAVLLDVSMVKDDENIGLYFDCAYCGTVNKIGSLPEGYKGGTDVEYLLEKGEEREDLATTIKQGLGEELVGAVIDISGSMSGGKLAAVRHNLMQTLKGLKVNSPSSNFILVTFESIVDLYLYPMERSISISEDKFLHDEKKLGELIRKKVKSAKFNILKESADQWVDQVSKLSSRDMTALGPGLVTGIQVFVAKEIPGRILLLTDGLANVGFGRLEGASAKKSREFYNDLASLCLDRNIVVDIVGVGGGNELALDILGILCEKTGGELYFVTQEQLDRAFGELSSRRFVGRDVRVRVFTPKSLDVDEISGVSAAASKAKRFQEIKVGSVTKDREALIKFDVKDELEEEEIPVQVQVTFRDSRGNKKLRVFETRLKREENEARYRKEYDPKPMTVMNIQKAGNAYSKGDVKKAKQVLGNVRAQVAEMDADEDVAQSLAFLDDEMEQIAEFEKQKVKRAPKSFSAAMGQKRSRISMKKKMQELKEDD